MKILGKRDKVKLYTFNLDLVDNAYNQIIGVATYKIGLFKKATVKFGISKNQKPQPIYYIECAGTKIPQKELQNNALLILIYGEYKKYQGQVELYNFFAKKAQENLQKSIDKNKEK